MIQPLRAVHRRAFVTLTLVLPAILLIGLWARHSRSRTAPRAAEVPPTAHLVMESSKLWQKHSIQSKFYRRSDRPQEIDLVLQPAEELNEPDLLLYWATNAPQGNVLLGDAQLMGALRTGRAFLLPLNENPTGTLVLFSPAHQTVFDTAKVEKLP
jgi:hypothetical protein